MMIDRCSLLLAHGLGLGKTVTSIAVAEELIDTGEAECVLVVCLASLKWQWKRQIDEFSDGALTMVVEGPAGARKAQYRSVKRGDAEYVIMNYDQIVNDWEIVRFLTFDAVFLDEITAIKNPGALRTRHLRRITAPYKFGLTGQPIENRPEDLYHVMKWIDPAVLGPETAFDKEYIVRRDNGTVVRYHHLAKMRASLAPAMHRKKRSDPDVKSQMPKLVEPPSLLIDFDPATKRVYRHIVGELLDLIDQVPHFSTFNLMNHYAGVGDNSAQGQIMARLMALRMLCDHPALLRHSGRLFKNPKTKTGSQYAADLLDTGMLDKLKATPKLNAVMDQIEEILSADPKNKVVLFSFFKPMLNIIANTTKYDYELFTGGLNPRERDAAIQRFQNDRRCRLFLSSDAGGVGVDLPVANYLISYDLPWSAGKLVQRKGRIDRLSSKWDEITLLSFLMKGSIEERQMQMLDQKIAVASAWLDGQGLNKQGAFDLTLGSLVDFLVANY